MPVKNLSAIGPSGNVKPIPIYHAIPPSSTAILKVTVDTDDGEVDITDTIRQASFNVGVTSTIGDFNLSFIDSIKTNYNKINLFDDVYLYADYGTEATTKRFRFKVENKGFVDFSTTISGRGIGMILAEKSIIYQTLDGDGALTTMNKSDVIQEIIENNFSEITDFSEIETDTTQIQKSYFEIPFFDVIEELCGIDKYFYLDKDLVPHYFTKGSRVNTTEAIADGNLVKMNDNSDNAEEIYTRVRVYGQKEGDIPIIYTKAIGTTNTGGINKDYIINNSSVVSNNQANTLANAEANNFTYSTRLGDMVSLFLPSLVPGESLFVGLPEYDINPGYYNIKEFSINIDNEGNYAYTTQFTIEKKRTTTPNILKTMTQIQNEISENNNPHDQDFSDKILFNVDSGTHSNTVIEEGYLQVKAGSASGQWTSDIINLDESVSSIEFHLKGDLIIQQYGVSTSYLWYSLDGGATEIPYKVNGVVLENLTGTQLRFRIDLNSTTVRIKSVQFLYSY